MLIEGVPGLAKTLLVKALAQTLRRPASSASSSRPT
ncbi:MAG: AAA family ATPase [Comamonadaceae bacterium]|nr:AAA family ATPase [Comamonadaceae bacterium]